MNQPKLKVVIGGHYDPSERWAREPRLRGVLDIREQHEERAYQHSVVFIRACALFGLGYLFGMWMWG
jgi:hypothetical protein